MDVIETSVTHCPVAKAQETRWEKGGDSLKPRGLRSEIVSPRRPRELQTLYVSYSYLNKT